jgi:hypothetical protein
MECPKQILLQILSRALLSIRSYGFSNADSKRCGIEADHVHNLPGLVKSFSYSELRLYQDALRPSMYGWSVRTVRHKNFQAALGRAQTLFRSKIPVEEPKRSS